MYNSKIWRPAGCDYDGPSKAPLGYYVETDPSGRYGRLKEVLGKGAMKTVYRAFDEVLGMEVAWNQVTLCKEELQRLYSEVHLLKSLNHHSIINFHASWVDVHGVTFNFITEMFTSGTLREYRRKYRRVDIRAVKNWARQILHGLAYLHEHDPPVIHRDLKCDNIFVNGHLGQVKIGDLGLAAILRGSQHAHSVIGTPEFMAPELYEEDYDELVDIYSFGMCMLEMLTSEYPYSECSNPAQIYKKVTSGKLPEAFYRIEDEEAKEFVGKCLETASKRLPARELLLDPFLATSELELLLPIPKVPSFQMSTGEQKDLVVPPLLADESSRPTEDVTITGTVNPEDDTVFLEVHISDKHGHTRNIHFPFDIKNDTAIDVAMEMVKELEITDLEAMDIADMIEEEMINLLPPGKQCASSHVTDDDYQCSSVNDVEGLEEEMDDINNHPSQTSSSHASLIGLASSNFPRGSNSTTCVHNWLQGDPFRNDEASSQSSITSLMYSAINYCAADDGDPSDPLDQEDHAILAQKFTRLCVDDRARRTTMKGNHHHWGWGASSNPQRKLSRIRSMVDVRSRLLHKSLVEQINKRRLFNTVGAADMKNSDLFKL